MKKLLFALVLLAAACRSDNPDGVQSGTLTVTLANSGSNDGAIVAVVSGGLVTHVAVPSGYEVTTNTDAAGTHMLITGNVAAGALATLTIPDIARKSAYSVTIEQAADRTTFALLDAAGYRATLQ